MTESFVCPRCKGPTVQRTGKWGSFLGCASFPDCKGTLNLDGSSEHPAVAAYWQWATTEIGPDGMTHAEACAEDATWD